MKLNKIIVGQTYKLSGITQSENCSSCNPCLKLSLLEYGIGINDNIKILSKSHGFFKVQIENTDGLSSIKLAIRENELEKIFSDTTLCPIVFE